ncbi:MAG: PAS domain S-box protein [Marinoscillum sp.]
MAFFLLLLIGGNTTYLAFKVNERNKERDLMNFSHVIESNVEKSLSQCHSAAVMLAYTIDDAGEPRNFDSVAEKLISNSKYFDVLELVPDGVIKYIYPMAGNEAALDYNILADENRNKEAFKAAELRQMYYAGPVELKQGGMAIIGRLPVYIHNKFWGFSAVLINLQKFLASTGVDFSASRQYNVQITKVDPNTGIEESFLKEVKGFPDGNSFKVHIPDGEWNLYVGSTEPFSSYFAVLPMAILSLLLSVIAGFFVAEIIKKPTELQHQLDLHSKELSDNERRFRSFFEQAAVGVAHIDATSGEYLEVNDRYCKLFGYSKKEIRTKTFYDLTHPDDREISDRRLKDLRAGDISEYSLEKRYFGKGDKQIWANLTVSPLWNEGEEPNSFLVILEDISEKKELQEQILENSIQAQEMEKNRIASEIHDGIVQEMVACGIYAEHLEKVIKDPVELQKRIIHLTDLIKKITNDTRSVSHDLMSADVNQMRLSELMGRLEHQLKGYTQIDVKIETHLNHEEDISKEVKVNTYRTVQELLTNIIKHSKATFASICLEEIGDDIFVTIRDNGVGMQNTSTIGIGSYNIRNRINKIGGTIEYHHPRSGGLEVSFSVPIS